MLIRRVGHSSPAAVEYCAGFSRSRVFTQPRSASDITALLSNCGASVFGTATIANFGTIQGNVDLSGVGKITNFGTILAHADSGGGILINGSASDTTAYCGYGEMHGGAVVNYATIGNTLIAEFGALVSAGATLTNGSVTDMVALIYGYTGVLAYSSSTVTNLAKVEGRGRGVSLYNSTFVNGSASNTAASVDAYGDGVQALRDFVTIANFATIVGTVSHGVDVWYGGNIVNGTVSDTAAVIEGKMGVYLKGPGTLTNFGTITGTGGTAVELRSGADVLVVEAGSAFGGAVIGHSSTIVLASGTGTLSGLGGGDVTVSGSMVTTTFTSFKIVEIGAGGHFTASGSATIDSGDSLIDVGGQLTLDVLTNNGALTVKGGSLTVAGPVTGSGVATLNTGAISFGSSFSQNVSFVGSQGMLQLADSRDYAATITGFSTNGRTSLDLGDISFVSASEATFSGTATSGVLTVTDGTRTARITLMGNYLSSPFAASSDGHGGVIVVASSPAAFVAAMAGLATSAPANSYAKTTPTGSESLLASPKWAGLH
jgi:hypothetical protein